jgi:hypothetical protein
VEPPKPRLFRAIAFFGILLGAVGALSAVGNLTMLSRAERQPVEVPGLGPPTEAQAKVTRRMQERVERVIERHRPVSTALHLANAALSLLLLAGGLTLATGRTWAHGIMVQALAASVLYELPAAAHEIRLLYEKMLAMKRLFPELLAAQHVPALPEHVALASGGFLAAGVAITLGLAFLRLAYYGTGFWYLRRQDVRSWFRMPRDM